MLESELWAQETFGSVDTGDKRRNRRLVQLASQLAEDPEGSLPQQTGGSWAELKAAYRLLRADGVTHQAISEPVWQQTRRQLDDAPGVVLLVHDDTELDYGYAPAIQGVGPIGNGSHQGLLVHSVLAVVPHETHAQVMGLMAQEPWVRHPAPRHADGSKPSSRKRRQRERESQVWERSVRQIGAPPASQMWLHVGDRYADIWTFLHTCRQQGTQFVVRAAQNRCVSEDATASAPPVDHLLDRARGWEAQAEGEIEVPSEHERRARRAQVRLSWGAMSLPPKDSSGRVRRGARPVRVWVVRVWEPDPPSKQEAQREYIPVVKHGHGRRRATAESATTETVEPLEWILLSSVPVESAAQAWQVIHWYRKRWLMEDFHRGLKSGCRIEQRHLQEERSLENLLALLSPIAVRLLQWRTLSHEQPAQPASAWVSAEEVQVIAAQEQVPEASLTSEHFMRGVARLGGFLGRTSDGTPGWQTLWHGWHRLHWMVAGMRFAASARSPCTCG